jgi:hypothetical protein
MYEDNAEDVFQPTPTPVRSKYAAPVNSTTEDSEPKISKAKFAKAAKNKTENNGSATATKGTQTSVPMCSPNKKWWIRCHASAEQTVPGLTLLIVEEDGSEVIYVLSPDVEFPDDLDNFTCPATVTRAITSQGNEFLWLTKQSPKSPKESARRCQAAARKGWIQVRWNAQLKGYTYISPRELRREPEWSTDTIDELMEKAFGDKFIDRSDHPAVNHLLFPNDDAEEYGE